jgi:hypothetical protein
MALTDSGALEIARMIMNDAPTLYTNANARIGVGDSATAFAVGQNDLVAATNKLRKAMDATYPQRSTNVLTFRSTFATGEANWTWSEWGIFNAGPTGGTMLNRKVEALGVKTSSQSWELTCAITISST